jgi:hypothetical protein
MMQRDDSNRVRRRRVARGRRPFFFADANTDKLLAMIAALAGEVAVLRQRVDTHERVAAERGAFSVGDIEAYAPTTEISDERARWRQEFLQRVFRILEFEYTQPEIGRDEAAYSAMIAKFAAAPPAASRSRSSATPPRRRGGKAAAPGRAAPARRDRSKPRRR